LKDLFPGIYPLKRFRRKEEVRKEVTNIAGQITVGFSQPLFGYDIVSYKWTNINLMEPIPALPALTHMTFLKMNFIQVPTNSGMALASSSSSS
jgi:hypothetical protein